MPPLEEDGLADALGQTAFVIMAVLSKLGAEHDMSLTQLRVLGVLRDRRLRVTTLAGYLGLEKSTMSGLVDRAERRGLLDRAPSPEDKRAVEVFLTSAGAELAASLYAEFSRSLSDLMHGLTPADRRRLLALLQRVLDSSGPETAAAH